MSATPSSDSWMINLTPKTYKEEIEGRGTEPRKRGLSFVLHCLDRKWHVKLTFYGKLQSAKSSAFAKVAKRRKDLENLCLCIDFDPPQLLNDTTPLDPESEYADIVNNLRYRVQEDPYRVRFPTYDGRSSGVPTRHLLDIKKIQELGMGVYRVYVDNIEYVYKEVDRPLYVPRDSDVLEQELRNLERLRDSENVVKLIAAVVSDNPYRTTKVIEGDTPASLQGILLEYHPNGTLQHALQLRKSDVPWLCLALQITRALHDLHQHGIPHMDLKPENIVLNKDFHPILIDVSGIGGTTRKWLSPEMRLLLEPWSQGIEARKQNDIWALGQILSVMSQATYSAVEQEVLRNVSLLATTEIPPRIPLQEIFSIFSFSASTLTISDIVPINVIGVKAAVRAGT
ncbi:hypothetical protein B7494_g7119 [Chlorociboria aeruginascens]|nr:hypothetical protein B7494_g7119 [Chlorociboria aeruginascens]